MHFGICSSYAFNANCRCSENEFNHLIVCFSAISPCFDFKTLPKALQAMSHSNQVVSGKCWIFGLHSFNLKKYWKLIAFFFSSEILNPHRRNLRGNRSKIEYIGLGSSHRFRCVPFQLRKSENVVGNQLKIDLFELKLRKCYNESPLTATTFAQQQKKSMYII